MFLQTLLFLLVLVVNICKAHPKFAGSGGVCRESERMALLKVKAELVDDYGRLSSWESTNCCEWKGVVCDNRTNHVVALDLHGPEVVPNTSFSIFNFLSFPEFLEDFKFFPSGQFQLSAAPLKGKISPSLLQLSHLQYLDVSSNCFYATTIPNFIGSLSKLQHLNLSHSCFGGQIPHHIGNLSLLQLLDLRGNRLTDTNLDWLSGSPSLQYLDLSYANLSGSTAWLQVIEKLTALREIHLSYCRLPPISAPSLNSSSNSLLVLDLSFNYILDSGVLLRFFNMSSSFTYIDFSSNKLTGGFPSDMWNLMSLSHLYLGYNRLDKIPNVMGNLTSLSYLVLSYNQLQIGFPRPSKNSTSLTHLDLSQNKLEGQLSHLLTWLWDSTNLKFLSLRKNALSGLFPNMSRFSDLSVLGLGNNILHGPVMEGNLRLPKLKYLDLSENKFRGRLPNLSSSPSLIGLILTDNIFSGSWTEYINHRHLEYLKVGYNRLEGVVSEAHLDSLPQLRVLDLSFNVNISIRIGPSWMHPVQFLDLMLAYCKIGPQFPKWLHKQNQLQFLDISHSEIQDSLPSWFWGNIQRYKVLNMSHNQIHGVLPHFLFSSSQLVTIDLTSNLFTGSLPHFPFPLASVYLSRNKFSGSILSFCNLKIPYISIDLSNNLLSGEIPQDCFKTMLSLDYLNLANNNLSGVIPTTNNLECHVSSLHLRNNSFRGEIPRSLMNCTALRILDLGENEFSGMIPEWFGDTMPNLGVLILKSNLFYGSLPSSICRLSSIQVLDISLNKITGTIPSCVDNFTQLSSEVVPKYWKNLFYRIDIYGNSFYDSASVVWKGLEETYINNLGLMKMIDLSSNELCGEIPPQIMTLVGLVGLNLSRNNLVGIIPRDIDKLKFLNFLDLSRNNLSGSIPLTLSKLSHLGVLNLSFNNLSGRIPWDTHMQTFESSTYLGNPRLCGPPLLSKPCPEDHEKPKNGAVDSEDEDKLISRGFYISMLLGFIAAFWIVFWALFSNKWWNAFSMKICVNVADCMYVQIIVNKRRLLKFFFGDA